MITFKAKLYVIGEWVILRVPEAASEQLPSRGQVMVQGTFNGTPFESPLEPDGNWSHWLNPSNALLKQAGVAPGDMVELSIEATKKWPEPAVPGDIQKGIVEDKTVGELWHQITPMARWEWIRWIRSTNKDETRSKRIEVARDKMIKGWRRPCCWNRNLSTVPEVSKGGRLLALA